MRSAAYWWKLLLLATRGVRAQRLRAFLSAFGVTVGVAAVIAILAIGDGARSEVLRQVAALGLDNILVQSATAPVEGQDRGDDGLRVADALRLARVSPAIESVVPAVERWTTATAAGLETRARLVGSLPAIERSAKLAVQAGRFLADDDSRQRRAVCVLGADVARRLFRLTNPIGRRVDVEDRRFRVVGVLTTRARLGGDKAPVRTHDLNYDVYVPLETLVPSGITRDDWPLSTITVVARERASVLDIAGIVRSVLERTHRRRSDYEVVVPLELVERSRETQRTLNTVLAGIAALSLLVGGTGIMNIMLATVTERTREIGVRRAVGATSTDIRFQFLAEAAMITLLGGAAGVAIGVVASLALGGFGGWPVRVSFSTVGAALVLSVASGLVFGLYPALKASAADPIEALRYE